VRGLTASYSGLMFSASLNTGTTIETSIVFISLSFLLEAP
jgi:hypothetical protein